MGAPIFGDDARLRSMSATPVQIAAKACCNGAEIETAPAANIGRHHEPARGERLRPVDPGRRGVAPGAGGDGDRLRHHQQHRVEPGALRCHGQEVLRGRGPEGRHLRGGLRGRRAAAAGRGLPQHGAGCDRPVPARHLSRRPDPDRSGCRVQRAVPCRCSQNDQELERSQGQGHQRRRPHRRDALFPAGDGAPERSRRPGLRSALRRRHAEPLRAARVRGGRQPPC